MFAGVILVFQAILAGIVLGWFLSRHSTTSAVRRQEAPTTRSRKTLPTWLVATAPTLVAWLPAQAPAGDGEHTLDDAGGWYFPPLTALRPGALLHGFLVQQRIGKGGQGEVSLARAPDGRQIALKGTTNPVAWATETVLLRQLRHPGIPGFVAAFQSGASYWVAEEYVPGCTPLPGLSRAVVLALGVQVAHILAYVHAQGIVHRDVKPENLRLRPDGSAVLLDFGLARIKGWPGEAPAGTKGFVPPEQLVGASCPHSDVYALGATLWELLAGALPDPFLGTFPPLPPDCPPHLERLLRRMLALQSQQRPAAAEVEAHLFSLLPGPDGLRKPRALSKPFIALARRCSPRLGECPFLPWNGQPVA